MVSDDGHSRILYTYLHVRVGNLYANRVYKSVRSTGWVVNFEQTRAMVQWVNAELAEDSLIVADESEDRQFTFSLENVTIVALERSPLKGLPICIT